MLLSALQLPLVALSATHWKPTGRTGGAARRVAERTGERGDRVQAVVERREIRSVHRPPQRRTRLARAVVCDHCERAHNGSGLF